MRVQAVEVAAMIDASFIEGVIPDASRVVSSSDLEAQQVKNFFAGKKWQDVTLRTLQNDYVGDGSACLWCMTPEAVAYYLPAYLKIAALEYFEGDAISTELMIKLRRVAEGEGSNIADGIASLDAQQNKVIAHVLNLVASEYEATGAIRDAPVALSLRWGRYLDAAS